jgi:hypothetical protein
VGLGTTNSKPPGPIIMIDQSEILNRCQIIFITLFSACIQHCCSFHQAPQCVRAIMMPNIMVLTSKSFNIICHDRFLFVVWMWSYNLLRSPLTPIALLVFLKSHQQGNVHLCHFTIFKLVKWKLLNLGCLLTSRGRHWCQGSFLEWEIVLCKVSSISIMKPLKGWVASKLYS